MRSILQLWHIIVFFCLCTFAGANVFAESLTIDDIQFQIYDTMSSSLKQEPTNIYGNAMDLFVAVKLTQSVDTANQYMIKLHGFGKGRENEAEGVVEDYSVQLEKKVSIYGKSSRYFPFIVDYPCTDVVNFVIEVWKDKRKIASKKAEGIAGCYLN